MNNEDLVYIVSKKIDKSYNETYELIEMIFNTIKDELIEGECVTIRNFGGFEVVERAERKGFNPHTREEIVIPKCKEPIFKSGKELKEIINR